MNRFTWLILILLTAVVNAQSPSLPGVTLPQPSHYRTSLTLPQPYSPPNSNDLIWKNLVPDVRKQNQQVMRQIEVEQERKKQLRELIERDAKENGLHIQYNLLSFSKNPATQYYYEAFDALTRMDSSFSLKEAIFLIENAYFENRLSKEDFDNTIKQSGAFLKKFMQENGYDPNSNLVRNFMLFQFFSGTMQLKSDKKAKHLPFQYDFEDYMGKEDWSKMFVTKLLETGSGQCHSMPLLYLILADEIGAEAYLSLSPNHSYIRFPDDAGKWHDVELTNGMFSTPSFILQSGYIKSEALLNKIYMQNLSRKELLSHLLSGLANGYIHKFGYDEFIGKVTEQALRLYPNSLNGHMLKSNINTARFEFVMRQLGINPHDRRELQTIRYYPKAVQLLQETNRQYHYLDNLGFEEMPEEAYEKWLQSMTQEKQKRENDAIQKQIKGLLKSPAKN